MALDGQRLARGALDFESLEVIVELDAEGRAVGIAREARTRAHRLVEETMIAANVAASDEVSQRSTGALYRNHGLPCPRRFAAVQSRGSRDGVKVGRPSSLSVGDLSMLIRKSPGLAPFIRQAQAKANYAPIREGHYGLGLKSYAHFTSPIRRYPDILVHRALKAIGMAPAEGVNRVQAAEDLRVLSLHLSEREASASAAEREATDRLRMTWLVRQPSSNTWAGTVNGVTRMGLFVTLDDCGGSGLLPMPSTATYDEKHMCWTMDDEEWTLGTSVQVRLEAVDAVGVKMTLGWDVTPMPKPSRSRAPS